MVPSSRFKSCGQNLELWTLNARQRFWTLNQQFCCLYLLYLRDLHDFYFSSSLLLFELWTLNCGSAVLCGHPWTLNLKLWTLNQQLRCPLWTSLNFERATALLNFEPAAPLPYLWTLCYLCEVFIIGRLLLFEPWTRVCAFEPWTRVSAFEPWTSISAAYLWAKLWTLNARQRIWTLNQQLRCVLLSLHSRLFPLFLLVFLIFHRRGGKQTVLASTWTRSGFKSYIKNVAWSIKKY